VRLAWTRPAFDLSLYLVTDPALVPRRDLVQGGDRGGRGRVTIGPALRDKDAGDVELVVIARELRAALPRTVPLIVNDRVAVALAGGAEGVHVGWTDAPAAEARAAVGPDRLVGQSATSDDEVGTARPPAARLCRARAVRGDRDPSPTPARRSGRRVSQSCGGGSRGRWCEYGGIGAATPAPRSRQAPTASRW
jgi:hypothetical protein